LIQAKEKWPLSEATPGDEGGLKERNSTRISNTSLRSGLSPAAMNPRTIMFGGSCSNAHAGIRSPALSARVCPAVADSLLRRQV